VRCGLRQAPRAALGTEPTPLAGEGDELVVPAVGAEQAQETVRQDAALEEGVGPTWFAAQWSWRMDVA